MTKQTRLRAISQLSAIFTSCGAVPVTTHIRNPVELQEREQQAATLCFRIAELQVQRFVRNCKFHDARLSWAGMLNSLICLLPMRAIAALSLCMSRSIKYLPSPVLADASLCCSDDAFLDSVKSFALPCHLWPLSAVTPR